MIATLLLALALAAPQGTVQKKFETQTDLQALYDEISQLTLSFVTPGDIDDFHDVICTPDWTFVDKAGQKESWQQYRAQLVHALSEPKPDSVIQAIDKISLAANSVTAVVEMTTVRPQPADANLSDQAGSARTVVETVVFRDTWIRDADSWKLSSRQQIAGPVTSAGGVRIVASDKWAQRHVGNLGN
jgi:hypothetical protein